MKNIDRLLDNAFKIKRVATKHAKKFKYNEFTRPLTLHCFFQLLAESDINFSSYELQKYVTHITATDYMYNWRSGGFLIITKNKAYLKVGNDFSDWIDLNYEKILNMYSWFKDESLFNTDFGDLYKSEKYYKQKTLVR